ncbi:MAG: hypothetical protein JWM19_1000 [Actinomycetia bacterium]|nr:hypothetical protein [Actinomycetes bacterium]
MQGSMGQDHSAGPVNGSSWRQAQQFASVVGQIMEAQSADSNRAGKMHPPALFSYPAKDWRFPCYVKSLTDPDGGNSVIMTPSKINQRYTLTLFIVQEGSAALVKAGTTNGVFSQKAYDAVSAFMARISDGIGWHYSVYNGQPTGTRGAAGTG